MKPAGSGFSIVSSGRRRSSGSRSGVGNSHQSASSFCSAAAAVEASGMMRHSTRSNQRALGAGRAARRALLAWAIPLEAGIGDPRAGDALIGQEAVGAAADRLADLDRGIGLAQAFGHDEADRRRGLGQRVEQQREGPLQAELMVASSARRARRSRPAGSGRGRRARPSGGCGPRRRARAPACRRGTPGPGAGGCAPPAILLHGMAGGHLRLRAYCASSPYSVSHTR